jgi:hypothetical protein
MQTYMNCNIQIDQGTDAWRFVTTRVQNDGRVGLKALLEDLKISPERYAGLPVTLLVMIAGLDMGE